MTQQVFGACMTFILLYTQFMSRSGLQAAAAPAVRRAPRLTRCRQQVKPPQRHPGGTVDALNAAPAAACTGKATAQLLFQLPQTHQLLPQLPQMHHLLPQLLQSMPQLLWLLLLQLMLNS